MTSAPEALLSVRDLRTYFPTSRKGLFGPRGSVKAVDGLTFDVYRGETLGLVGESGCGKSTTGRAVIRLVRPTGGEVIYNGRDLTQLSDGEMRRLRQKLQIIFQDAYASLSSRMRVGAIIGDALAIHNLASGRARAARVGELLHIVGLDPSFASRYPHEFSGGQRQRIGIARALAVNPDFIVCDEPISALDVSIRAQIINLLEDLQRELKLTYLFIAHDLAVVRHICDRVAVMYLGKFMELSANQALYAEPLHPYTQSLISAVPVPDPDLEDSRQRIILSGDVPSPVNPPSGCVFHTRCPIARDQCKQEIPAWREVKPGHWVACHFAGESIARA
ncbi:MAG: oligopeptide/dipeptide transporter, ATPase subunit [Chloroflexi bacterium]|nr:oligopeptide/dipeptide transporter, ATPase subunit [Chloroflexota bacterium]MDB5075198.1 oligopeptide/dipeptide transporter, ATPase subunit [Chloroflexota bacterium]